MWPNNWNLFADTYEKKKKGLKYERAFLFLFFLVNFDEEE